KMSCAGNSSNSESSSYRPSPLECKAPPREPRGALVCEAGNAVGLGLDRCQSVLRRQPAALEIGADVSVTVAALGQPFGTKRRRSLVVEVAEAIEPIECPLPLLVVE